MNYQTNQPMCFANSQLNHSVLLSLDTVIAVSIFIAILSLIPITILGNNVIVISLVAVILNIQINFPHEGCTHQIRT